MNGVGTRLMSRRISDVFTKRSGGKLLRSAMPILALLMLVIVFSIASDRFFTGANALNVLRQSSVLLIVALGATFVILMGSIDLSVGAVVTMTGTITALLLRDAGWGVWTLVAAAAVGLVAGLLNGSIFAYGMLPSFLVTLGTMSIFKGATNLKVGGAPVAISNARFMDVITGTWIGSFPNIAIWALLLLVICTVVAFRTRFGRYLFAIGGGERVAKLAGVPVKRYKLYAFAVCGLLAGFAGAVMAGRIGAATPGMGDEYLLDSIAATVMGGTALTGGLGGPHRTLLGVLVIGVLSNGLNVAGVDYYWQMVAKGVVVIVAVALTLDRAKVQMNK